MVLQTAIIGWRWHRIVRFLGGSLPPVKAIHWVFEGLFFSQTLPTSVGGDVVRIWNLHRHGSAPGVAFSVAIERGTGVVLLGLLVTLCLPTVWISLSDPLLRAALLAVGPCLLAGLVFVAGGYKSLVKWLPGPARYGVSVANAWVDFWTVPILWNLDRVTPGWLGSPLAAVWWVEHKLLRMANAAFVMLVFLVLISRRVRLRVKWDLDLTAISALILLSSILQALADQGASSRYAVTIQALVVVVVMVAWLRFREERPQAAAA